jgi:energy-coupling factor transporter ATP-binding protein EcfA2
MKTLVRVEIWDTFGCQHVTFKPKTWTWLKGHNGSGKSSVLRALGYVFEGGTDPSVIRKGADFSRVEMELNDGTVISKITRPKRARKGSSEPTAYTTDLEIIQPDGQPTPAPKAYIDALGEHLAIDPSTLLRIDASTTPGRKQLAAELMRLVPIEFSQDEVRNALARRPGVLPPDLDVYPARNGPLSLDGLKTLAAEITEVRRKLGASRDASGAAADRLQKSLPDDDGGDYSEALAALEKERKALEQAIFDRSAEIERMRTDAIATAKETMNTAIAAAKEDFRKAEHSIASKVEVWVSSMESVCRPQQDRITAEIAAVTERRDASLRVAGVRDEIELNRQAAREAAIKYDRLSEVLRSLDELKLEKLDALPIAGLVVEEGTAYIDGVEWPNVNLAKRVEVTLQICAMRAGDLKLMILDDCEHLDTQTRSLVEQGLADAGWQIICATVTDGPLAIEVAQAAR